MQIKVATEEERLRDWTRLAERGRRSSQNKEGNRIIIPAGQRPAAMRNGALRCKRVGGISDSAEFDGLGKVKTSKHAAIR